jgi:hypothetical protein
MTKRTRLSLLRAAAGILAVLGASSAASALPLTASIGYAGQVVTSRSYDMVDNNDHLPALRLSAGYLFAAPRGALELGLGYQTGSTDATLHAAGKAGLWMRGLDLSATYRYRLADLVEPYARLSAGYEWATLSIGDDDGPYQRVSNPVGTAMIGTTFPALAGERLPRIAVDFGIGYALRPAFNFDALKPSTTPPSTDAIAQVPLSVGALPASGIVYQIALTLRI